MLNGMVWPCAHGMVSMLWYMVWPGGHRMLYGMAWRTRMVYSMAWQALFGIMTWPGWAWHGIWYGLRASHGIYYGLVGIIWYMVMA